MVEFQLRVRTSISRYQFPVGVPQAKTSPLDRTVLQRGIIDLEFGPQPEITLRSLARQLDLPGEAHPPRKRPPAMLWVLLSSEGGGPSGFCLVGLVWALKTGDRGSLRYIETAHPVEPYRQNPVLCYRALGCRMAHIKDRHRSSNANR